MSSKSYIVPPVEEFIASRERWEKKREAIRNRNDALIKKWKSEQPPWWKFWDRGLSFEQKRSIILSNWSRLEDE